MKIEIKKEKTNFVHLKGKIDFIGENGNINCVLERDCVLMLNPKLYIPVSFVASKLDHLTKGQTIWLNGEIKLSENGEVYVQSSNFEVVKEAK